MGKREEAGRKIKKSQNHDSHRGSRDDLGGPRGGSRAVAADN